MSRVMYKNSNYAYENLSNSKGRYKKFSFGLIKS